MKFDGDTILTIINTGYFTMAIVLLAVVLITLPTLHHMKKG